MSPNSRTGIVVLALVVTTVGAAVFPPIIAAQTTAGNTVGNVSVAVDVTKDYVGEGQTAVANITVAGADSGIETYDLTLTVEGDTNITSVEPTTTGEDGPLMDIRYTDDRNAARIQVVTLDAAHAPADVIDLLKVTLRGEQIGNSTVQVDRVHEITDSNGEGYQVDAYQAAELSVIRTVAAELQRPTSQQTLRRDETYRFPVVVRNASDGLSTFSLTVATNDSVRIEGMNLSETADDGPLTQISYRNDHREMTVEAVLLDATYEPNDTIEIGELRIHTVSNGEATISINKLQKMNDLSNSPYGAEQLDETSVSIESTGSGGSESTSGGSQQYTPTTEKVTETTTYTTVTEVDTTTISGLTDADTTTISGLTEVDTATIESPTDIDTKTQTAVATTSSGPGFSVVLAIVAILGTMMLLHRCT